MNIETGGDVRRYTRLSANSLFAQVREPVRKQFESVEQTLHGLTRKSTSPIGMGAHQLVTSGGKRIRALMALNAADLVNLPPSLSQNVACALELVHAASLAHDDVLDGANLRRGSPSARSDYGNARAILIGDYLLAQAFACAAKTNVPPVVERLARVVERMVDGEATPSGPRQDRPPTIDEYFAVVDKKTGALCKASATACWGLSTVKHRRLQLYGKLVGRVLQILNDIEDCSTDCARAGTDFSTGAVSLPILLACGHQPSLWAKVKRSVLAEDPADSQISELRADTISTGAVHEALQVANELAAQAAFQLECFPANDQRAALAAIPQLLIGRRRSLPV